MQNKGPCRVFNHNQAGVLNRWTFENQTWCTIKRVSLEHFDTILKKIFCIAYI